jgi:hypothetical protein
LNDRVRENFQAKDTLGNEYEVYVYDEPHLRRPPGAGEVGGYESVRARRANEPYGPLMRVTWVEGDVFNVVVDSTRITRVRA